MRRRTTLARAFTATAAILLAVAAWGGETKHDYGVSASVGHETNPLLLASDGPAGTFGRLALDGSVTQVFNPTIAVFANASAQARFYGQSASNADFQRGDLRAGFGYAPRRFGAGRLALAAGGLYWAGRSTFVDRTTGDVYRVASISPTAATPSVAIADRFDINGYGAFVTARWRQNRTVGLFLDATLRRGDYVNDYEREADVSPLDYRSLTVEPGINLQLSRMLDIGFSVALTDYDYDARPALDESGAEVSDESRRYRYARVRTTFNITPAPRWSLQLGLRADDRSDRYAGYYDYGSWAAFASVERVMTPNSNLRLFISWDDLNYNHATVTDSSELVRGSDSQTLVFRYQNRVKPRLTWFADVGNRHTDSRDAVFAYDQNWVLTGIQFRR